MKIPVYYHRGYFAPIGDSHRMPIRKFGLVAECIRGDDQAEFFEPKPLTKEQLLRVHTQEYVNAIESGEPRSLAEMNKFPWSKELYPSVCLTGGGLLAAARHALKTGIASALVSGFHHSCYDHGEGFCTFNSLIVTLEDLKINGAIDHGAVLDMDLHYGNGTATLAASRPFVTAVSIYGNDYWDNMPSRELDVVRHHDGENHFSDKLYAGTDEKTLLGILERNLPKLLSRGKPDLLIYQAGADPYKDDPYSPLDLDHKALRARDKRVFEFCKAEKIPVVWVLAGGYTEDTSKVVQVHVNTFEACKEVYCD